MITTATIGKGKAIHAMRTTGGLKGNTLCITNDYCLNRALPVECDADAITCKRCLKELARLVEAAHAAAILENEEHDRATALAVVPTTRKTRRAARRAQARKLRATAAQTRSVARAARAKRNGTPAAARTLLVAAGLPDDVAKRYAPAFSKGVETVTPATSKRVRTGARRSKRVAVKLFTAAEFADRLATYRPKNAAHAELFALAA